MLGRLARWLRVLGFDTVYDPSLDDAALVRLADTEDRLLLTRDRYLLRELRPRRAIEITSDSPLQQLVALVTTLELSAPDELFTPLPSMQHTARDSRARGRADVPSHGGARTSGPVPTLSELWPCVLGGITCPSDDARPRGSAARLATIAYRRAEIGVSRNQARGLSCSR